MNATSLAFRPVEHASVPLRVGAVTRADSQALQALVREHAQYTRLERHGDTRVRGDARTRQLEFEEALFEPPVRAWAWLARAGGDAVGYAAATVGYSVLEGGYCFQLDALYVRDRWATQDVETTLFEQVRATARRLGCVQLQWQSPAWQSHSRRFDTGAERGECVGHVLRLGGHDD